jgi:RNA polymerase sigma-70 factor (ECF subfamily)
LVAQPAELDGLMPVIYDELKRLAGRHLRRQSPGHTLQTTALVHEAYLKLAKANPTECADRPRFFALASHAMRSVLVDHARRRLAGRRGFKAGRAPPEEGGAVVDVQGTEVLEVDRALARLAEIDSRKARIVELRYFGGLTADEAAEVLGISPVTIHRQWLLARTWLHRELGRATPE